MLCMHYYDEAKCVLYAHMLRLLLTRIEAIVPAKLQIDSLATRIIAYVGIFTHSNRGFSHKSMFYVLFRYSYSSCDVLVLVLNAPAAIPSFPHEIHEPSLVLSRSSLLV